MLFAVTLIALLIASTEAYDATYDISKSKRYVQFCGIAYCTDPLFGVNTVDNWSCKTCKNFPNVTAKSFYGTKATDAKGFVAYDGNANEIIVSFSGTDPASIRNWIDDIDFLKTDYPYCADSGCRVHEGFYRTYTSVDESVKSILNGFVSSHPSASISVTGHSLGAAMAAFGIAELTYEGHRLNTPYTFGKHEQS